MLHYRWDNHDHKEQSLEDFVRDPHGAAMIIGWMNDWAVARDVPRRFHLETYELMKENTESVLQRILDFFEIPVQDGTIAAAVAACTVEGVRKKIPHSNTEGDPRGWSIRRGEAGAYVDYLDATTQAWLDTELRDKLDPFWECYWPPPIYRTVEI